MMSEGPDSYPRRDFQDSEYKSYEKSYDDRDDQPKAVNQGTNLFVTGLSPKAREDDLNELFSAYGVVDKVQIMRDPHTDESRGFGFVNFKTVEEAERALALDGTVFMDRTLVIQKAKRGRARTPTPGSYRGPMKDRRDIRGPPPRYDPYPPRYDAPRYDRPRDYERGRPYDYPPDRYDRDRFYDRPPPPRDYRYDDRRMDDRRMPLRDDRGPPPRDYRDDYRRMGPPDDRRPMRDMDDRRMPARDERGPPPRDYRYDEPPRRSGLPDDRRPPMRDMDDRRMAPPHHDDRNDRRMPSPKVAPPPEERRVSASDDRQMGWD